MSDTQNPYAAPSSNVASDSLNQDVNKVKAFKRFTTWGVIGLAVITLGLYSYYWMHTRTKVLNKLIPENKVAPWIVPTIIILGLINFVLSFLPLIAPELITLSTLSSFIGLIVFILAITWAFMFRNRLNIISGSNKGDVFWLGPILTFFFSLYYLQYKINQMHDASR